MNLRRLLRRSIGSQSYRGEVLGRLIELRISSGGGETVLLDGAPVSNHPWAYFTGAHDHHFAMTDAAGAPHNVEVRVQDRSAGLQISLLVGVHIDGRPSAVLPEVTAAKYSRCPHCGYDLTGLSPDNGEIRCPECGRHTSARLVRER